MGPRRPLATPESGSRLGGLSVRKSLAPLCGLPAGSLLAGLLLKAGKDVMTMAKRELRPGNAAGHCKVQTPRGHGGPMKYNTLLEQAF
jgi:hypothetical protein